MPERALNSTKPLSPSKKENTGDLSPIVKALSKHVTKWQSGDKDLGGRDAVNVNPETTVS